MAVTGETWTEQVSFEGHASAVMIVTHVDGCAASRYEFRLEGLALGAGSDPLDVMAYFWDEREHNLCRDFYHSTFTLGSCWRISGKIESQDQAIVFIDPIYMPFSGKACELLRHHANLKVEV